MGLRDGWRVWRVVITTEIRGRSRERSWSQFQQCPNLPRTVHARQGHREWRPAADSLGSGTEGLYRSRRISIEIFSFSFYFLAERCRAPLSCLVLLVCAASTGNRVRKGDAEKHQSSLAARSCCKPRRWRNAAIPGHSSWAGGVAVGRCQARARRRGVHMDGVRPKW